MKTVTGLTKVNATKYGIEVREDLNFEDDGSYFRGFCYKGMPMTQCRSEGTCYLAIRVDYLNNEFTYDDWHKTAEYSLCNKYNGVNSFDIEELIQDVEKIIAKVDELNTAAMNEVIDTAPLREAMEREIAYHESIVEAFKATFKWYKASSYELKSLADYLKSEESNIARTKEAINEIESRSHRVKKEMTQRLEKYGYVALEDNGFYISQMKSAMQKYN